MINSGVSEHGSFEYLEWLIKASSQNLWDIVIYKTPYSDDHQVLISVFLSEFPEYLETLLLCKELFLITGDFNIPVNEHQDSDALKFFKMLEAFGLGATHLPICTSGWAHTRSSHHMHVQESGHQYT